MDKQRIDLPAGITADDLKSASWAQCQDVPYDQRSFELWYTTGFGWCIPTLFIGKGQRGSPDRTYAITLDNKPVRIGRGPHVLKTVIVYVRSKRLPALQKFLDLRQEGAAKAGTIRDRISSRRAQGQVERAAGRSHWRWDA